MRIHFLATSLALFCGLTPFASAQNYSTSPAGFLTTEAGTTSTGLQMRFWLSCSEFGAYPEYRTQIIDATHVGAGLRLLSAIDCRMDDNERAHAAEDRTWTNVSLSIGTGDYANATTDYSTNFSAPPTLVFSSSVNWPSVTGKPYTPNVAPWGAQVSFPISTWAQINTEATIMDFNFTGGTLASTAQWDENNPALYYLDAGFINIATGGYQYGFSAGNGCTDSGKTRQCNSYIIIEANSKDAAKNPDTWKLDVGIFNGADSTPYVNVYSLGRNTPSIPFPGVTCNGIGVDLAQAVLYQGVTTSANGGYRNIRNIPYVAVPPGVRIHLQAAWEDSVTGQVKLTNPRLDELMIQPPGLIKTLTQIGTQTPVLEQNIRETPLLRFTH